MTIQKNVASQKLHFLMVDATDFATPEPSMTVSAYYFKDGAARSTCSNSVSEITSGLYVLTLAATETNAGVATYQFTASGAADQYITVYPEDGYANKISSILADTITLSNATYGLDALETITSDILEALDSVVAGPLASILVDTNATLDNKIDSILADTTSILTDTGTTLDNKVDSILADTQTLSNATYGLDALETISSDILEAIDSLVAGPIASILVDTNATLDNKIDSILEDTKEINSQCDSILADTITLSNATYGLNALETIVSDILEALDSVTAGPIASILVDTNTTLDNKIDSILADTITLSNATYGLDALETIVSDILEAVDSLVAGPLASILVDTNTTLDNKIDSILEDTGATLPTATEIVDAFESQCQADPTGFHVNLKEINGTAVAGDGGATPWGP